MSSKKLSPKNDASKHAAKGGLKIKFTARGDRKGLTKDKSTVNRLKMYNQRVQRDRDGKVTYQAFQSRDTSHQARIEPNRRWFGPGAHSPLTLAHFWQDCCALKMNNYDLFIVFDLIREFSSSTRLSSPVQLPCPFLTPQYAPWARRS